MRLATWKRAALLMPQPAEGPDNGSSDVTTLPEHTGDPSEALREAKAALAKRRGSVLRLARLWI